MTYIIAEPCIDIKDLSCVDVCPVDCIHEVDRILVIDPEECIDCFAPAEQFFTPCGLRTFAELENPLVAVLTDDGFKPAFVKRFRRKPLVELELAPAFEERDRYGGTRLTTRNISRFRRIVLATPTHPWLLATASGRTRSRVGQFVPAMRREPQRDARELPARRAARARLRRRQLEQAGDPVRRASPLRAALRRAGREVQRLLRPGQLLAVPRRPSRLRRNGRRARTGEPQASAAGDGRHRVHRGLRRRLARGGRRSGQGGFVAAALDRRTRRSTGSSA